MFSRSHKGQPEEQLSDCSFCSGWTSRTLWNREKRPKLCRLSIVCTYAWGGEINRSLPQNTSFTWNLTFIVITIFKPLLLLGTPPSASHYQLSTFLCLHSLPQLWTLQAQSCLISFGSPAPSSRTQAPQTWSKDPVRLSKSSGSGG